MIETKTLLYYKIDRTLSIREHYKWLKQASKSTALLSLSGIREHYKWLKLATIHLGTLSTKVLENTISDWNLVTG